MLSIVFGFFWEGVGGQRCFLHVCSFANDMIVEGHHIHFGKWLHLKELWPLAGGSFKMDQADF